MTWLDRLKAHVPEASGLLGHRQNRQNPGSVSFGSPPVARIPASEGPTGGSEDATEAFEEWGDLRPCLLCRNLSPSGRCLAAWRGELRAARDWGPTFPEQPQRCIGYAPKADDPDQRPGRERWPELMNWQARLGDDGKMGGCAHG
jgi:hypothetical protein